MQSSSFSPTASPEPSLKTSGEESAPEKLTDITYEFLVENLPRECLDKLAEKTLEKRSVYVWRDRVFTNYKSVKRVLDSYTSPFEVYRIVFTSNVGEKIYVRVNADNAVIVCLNESDTAVR